MFKNWILTLKRYWEKIEALLEERSIASLDEHQLTFGRKLAHFWVLVGKSFIRNRCPLRASALAYTTLLALIPMLAVGVSVSTSLLKSESGELPIQPLINHLVSEMAPQLGLFPAESLAETTAEAGSEVISDQLYSGPKDLFQPFDLTPFEEPELFVIDPEFLRSEGAPQSDAQNKVAEEIGTFIQNINSGTLGLTGTAALILVAIGLLSTIEATFNDIWGVSQGRSWSTRIINYWTAITLGTLIVTLAMGIMIGSQFQAAKEFIQHMPFIGNLLFMLIPFVIVTGAFTLFYQFMPNTHVNWRAALVGGVVGGLLWNFNSSFNVFFVGRVASAGAIYGSLGIIPVFLIGMYFSWLVVLFGAQVAYAFQNRKSYVQEKQTESINQQGRELVALCLMAYVGRSFQQGQTPPSAIQLGQCLGVPTRLINRLIPALEQARLILPVEGEDMLFAPARPLNQINCAEILQSLRAGQGQELVTSEEAPHYRVSKTFEDIQKAGREPAEALTLEQLVNQLKEPAPEEHKKLGTN